MSKPRAFIVLPLPDSVLGPVLEAAEVDVWKSGEPPSRDELLARVADAAAILISPQFKVDAALLEAAPRLLAVSTFSVGFDHIDVEAATQRGVVVGNTPDVLTDAVADLTIGLILALARRMLEGANAVRERRWVEGLYIPLGTDPKGKTLAIIGMGRIGCAVAVRAAAFGMRTIYYDARKNLQPPVSAEQVGLEQALREADFVSIHVNLSEDTRRMIGAAQLALMKPTAFLVNTARGAVVDQPALYEALRDGKIAGAALDVTDPEPPDPQDPLLELPNALIIPHQGSATRETRRAMLELSLRNLAAGVKGELPEKCVNPEALARRRGMEKG